MNPRKYDQLISVIVPLYNVEHYMKKCIDSILDQSYRAIEIILVDDGSPDKSGEIADNYAQNNNNITVIHKKNGGLSSARNIGLKQAKGDFILFVDSDDWIDHTLIEESYNSIIKYGSDICVFNVRRIYEDSTNSFIQGNSETTDLNIKEFGGVNYIREYLLNPKAHRYSAWNRLYHRKFLLENDLKFEPNVEIHSEDLLFNLQCAVFARKISYIKKPLYNHLLREGTISSSKKPKLTSKLLTLVKRYVIFLQENGFYYEYKQIIPDLTQYAFYMSMASEINLNRLKIKELYNVILECYKFPFFKDSMQIMGKRSTNKRNFISLLLGYKKVGLVTILLHTYLKRKNGRD